MTMPSMRNVLLALLMAPIHVFTGVGLQGPSPGVTSVSPDGREFIGVFNAASDRTRLVTVFSPTCGRCLKGAADIQNILRKEDGARIKVMVLWAPILRSDSRGAAQQATAYLRDPRAEHFWDVWNFGWQHYTERFRYPKDSTAWDIFVLYRPHLAWHKSSPEPTVWLQDRGPYVGLKYTAELLHEHIKTWTR